MKPYAILNSANKSDSKSLIFSVYKHSLPLAETTGTCLVITKINITVIGCRFALGVVGIGHDGNGVYISDVFTKLLF